MASFYLKKRKVKFLCYITTRIVLLPKDEGEVAWGNDVSD
jgi:hypothetical protein